MAIAGINGSNVPSKRLKSQRIREWAQQKAAEELERARIEEYRAKVQTEPETAGEKQNRNRRFECPECQAVIWHGGFEPRSFCVTCYRDSGRLVTFEYRPANGRRRLSGAALESHLGKVAF